MYEYGDDNRIGYHICYISDLIKMRQHYHQWSISISLDETIGQIVLNWQTREAS